MIRRKFLKLNAGTAAGVFLTTYASPMVNEDMISFLMNNNKKYPELLILDSNPPPGTKAVRYYIDDMKVSELTDLYAIQTNTTPVWKTVIDPEWFGPGTHDLRIEADTPMGVIILEKRRVSAENKKINRNNVPLSGAWEFAVSDDLPSEAAEGDRPQAVQPGFEPGNWTTVMVPNSLGCIDQKWNNYKGILGVYRRNIMLEPPSKKERLAIVLNSCYWSGRVFINGMEVGQTHGGYLPSRFDITEAVRAGKNDIAIITDNRFSTMGVFRRLNEFYWNWGGLLQEVNIERTPEVAIIDLRAEGTQTGNLKLTHTGMNGNSSSEKLKVSIEVFDPSNRRVLGPESRTIILPEGVGPVEPLNLQIENPLLWDLDNPNLYTVRIEGKWGSLIERTGFRDVSTSGGDVLINGKVVKNLQGFNRHADYPGLGRTQPSGLVYQEMKELYDKGFRIFRPAHYPTTPAELDAADELGMLVIEEINVTGLKGAQLATKEVKQFGAQQLTKLIQRDRSHPSIIAWSVGNENLTDEEGAEEYIRDTITLGRSLDSTRLFTHVTMRATRDKTFEYQDIVAQNYYAGWYTGKTDAIVDIINSVQEYAGNKPILLSEYGAEAVIGRDGTEKGTEFYQSYIVDEHNRLLNKRKHFLGKLYWCSTEFWCRPNWSGGSPAPIPPFHLKSLVAYHREYKKLGWRVMFSPVRLSLTGQSVRKTQFGGERDVPSGRRHVINQDIKVEGTSGKAVKGTLVLTPPEGFDVEKAKYPFQIDPYGSTTIKAVVKGQIPEGYVKVNSYIQAIIDEDTEAQPLILTFNVVE